MPDITAFTVHGTPRPQGSKRHVGNGIMVEMNKNLPSWRGAIAQAAAAAHEGPLLEGPVSVTAKFVFVRPKGHYYQSAKRLGQTKPNAPRWPIGRNLGDIDKLLRALLDGITGVVVRDDCQVVAFPQVLKVYGEPARAEVRIEALSNGMP